MAGSDDIRIRCPNLACKRILAVPASAKGKLVRCCGCGINLRIPTGKVAEPAPAAEGAKTAPGVKPGAPAPASVNKAA